MWRSVPWRSKHKPQASSRRLLLWTALVGLIFGLVGFGELPEDMLRTARNRLHPHNASGQIVFVSIDDESLRQAGRWPWPRRNYAQMIDRLTAAGAKRIYFDIFFESASNPVDDDLFVRAIERSGRVTLPVRGESGTVGAAEPSSLPIERFRSHARLGFIGVHYNYQNAVWHLPYGSVVKGQMIPAYAASMAGRPAVADKDFHPDYSLKPSSIPTIPASTILAGNFDPTLVRGKDVLIGSNSEAIGDQYFYPGVGKMAGAFLHIVGAETLKAGNPVDVGWLPAYLIALALAALGATRNNPFVHGLTLAGGTLLLLLGPVWLEMRLVFADVTPGLFMIIVVASNLAWRGFRSRGLVNSVSGLPNLNALRANRAGRSQALIAARILNYAEIASTLPVEGERQLVDQIVGRLSVGSTERVFYHGDGGIFAWFDEPRLPFGHHLEALYALFRNPAKVAGLPIDLAVSFGVEIGSSRTLANRLASALVAADDAAHDGLKWKYHDPESLETASWRLSMLSQLDEAVDQGEVWVAYQPKLDLGSRRIVGAEALARWTHPEKGPIAASEFIAAAEQHDRIGKLTDFVLDQAIAAAASLNRRHRDIGMAVNLSARLLSDKGFTLRLSAMLARHKLPARLLTLELTETAELATSGAAMDMLAALRELGITISIDDYGTGLSTLDYLKKIPASEIKIDQSFVKGMIDNRSDRLMVQSTIGLAHELGRRVVAEGVERREILDTLIEMKCDVAQGYIIGRPMSLDALSKRIGASGSSRATG
jgi:EAL domain-containing protein (putative c-di-GMP-specific phosphodiesterase class I)/CHASE2 domain-containing sensor protein